MLKRLRIKIIAVVLGTLLLVFAAVLLVINISVYQTSDKRAEDFMLSVIENDGFMFPPRNPHDRFTRRDPGPFGNLETTRAGRFFYVKVGSDGKIFDLNLDMMYDFSMTDAETYISAVLDSERTKGEIECFSYIVAEKSYGQILVFAERSIEILLLEQLTKTSLWVAGIASLILAVLAAFLSNWIVSPVKTAFDKQRRFISDASHELKTPLTIISANVDVLQNEIGENTRLCHIRTQSERMGGLVHDLLTLAKTDEGQKDIVRSEFNLSGLLLNTALEFESRAFEDEKKYSYDIKDGLPYVGDEKQIKQLVSILIDNAFRYSDTNGQIQVSLRADGSHKLISVFNTGVGISDDERNKIFERFYRADESRARETGGYGIGLSIAKAISEAHKGKIAVTGKHGEWIRFDVIL